MSRPDILREIEEKVRERYFRDVEKLRHHDSVLNGKNYTDVMIEKLHKYGYYDPVNKILDDDALLKDEGVAKEYFIDQRDRLMNIMTYCRMLIYRLSNEYIKEFNEEKTIANLLRWKYWR